MKNEKLLVSGYRFQVAGYRLQVTGCRLQVGKLEDLQNMTGK